MNREYLKQVVAECMDLCDPGTDPELAAVRVAIVIEDVFGIRLSDSDIDVTLLSRPDTIVDVVTQHTGST